MSRCVLPQQFVQLQLQANRQIVRQDPLCQLSGILLNKAGRKQNIVHLFDQLLGKTLAVDDPEVQRVYDLFYDVWQRGYPTSSLLLGGITGSAYVGCTVQPVPYNYRYPQDPDHVMRSWIMVMIYFLGDYEFLYD